MIKKHLPSKLSDVIHQYPFYKKTGKQQLLFIHIPKTGGTSINRALSFPQPDSDKKIRKHYSVRDIKANMETSIWKNSFKFCFVRNPWCRLFSHYCHRHQRKALKSNVHYASFKKWLIDELTVYNKVGNLSPQIEWIKDEAGNIELDFIGRFEQLQDDFQQICKMIDSKAVLPHLNKSKLLVDYRNQYDQEMIDIVNEFYQEDISYFNFQF